MCVRSLLLLTLITGAAFAGLPATQPAREPSPCRFLEPGSWVITQAFVRSNGTPTAIKRKLTVTTLPSTPRAVEESKWNGSEFESTGPAKDCSSPDRRPFDELGLSPIESRPNQTLTLARKSFACTITMYEFRGEDARVTRLTLWRSAGVKLPPRTMSINNHELPLPDDALQADFTVEGPTISTRGQRRIIAMSSLVRVNGRACDCVVESINTTGTSNAKPVNIATREWSSSDLPGEKLRTLTTMAVGQMRVDSDVSVVDFHVAPRKAERAEENGAAAPVE